MTKTLPADLTNNNNNEEATAALPNKDEQKGLAELMLEMKQHLQAAASELLQPRAEAVEQLLQKSKSLG